MNPNHIGPEEIFVNLDFQEGLVDDLYLPLIKRKVLPRRQVEDEELNQTCFACDVDDGIQGNEDYKGEERCRWRWCSCVV